VAVEWDQEILLLQDLHLVLVLMEKAAVAVAA
jgi:hypothetical protein